MVAEKNFLFVFLLITPHHLSVSIPSITITYHPSSSLTIPHPSPFLIIPHHLSSSLIIPHHPSPSLTIPHHPFEEKDKDEKSKMDDLDKWMIIRFTSHKTIHQFFQIIHSAKYFFFY